MVVFVLFACAGVTADTADLGAEDSAGSEAVLATPGTLALAFQIDGDLVPQMTEAPIGAVLGAVYAEADATVTGPVDGAVPLYDFVTAALDLADGAPTGVAATTPPLSPGVVWLLACLDGDGNGCECGDPVTLPNANKVRVEAAAETPITVSMDLLHPC
ncbi:MAG: hypothetical protein Q8P41_32280 [Pseudomonadota bacterium]|nr:hypothetical protein [Pseudomonadota bacterium]